MLRAFSENLPDDARAQTDPLSLDEPDAIQLEIARPLPLANWGLPLAWGGTIGLLALYVR